MKFVLSTAIFCLIVSQTFALDFPYNRLKKSYEFNQEQCLERSERWMKILPNNPAGYYYASLIHFERAKEQSTTRKKYNDLSRSLKYARSLERMKVQSFLARVEWDTLTPLLNDFISDLESELEAEELNTLSAALRKKADRFDWAEKDRKWNNPENETIEILAGNTDKNENNSEVLTSSFSNGQYFGTPSGTEMITSHNLRSEREMLDYINEERLKKGMSALEWEEGLAKAARYHAYDMGSQDYFDHDSHDRVQNKLKEVTETFSRIKAFYTKSFANSENIAAGNEGAKQTYNQWYNSPGHYANMFNSSSKKVGIGVCYVPGSTYGYYWVFCTAL